MGKLTKLQTRQIKRAHQTRIFINKEAATANSFVPFRKVKDTFLSNCVKLDNVLQEKQAITTGITKNKAELKQQISNDAGMIASLTRAFALENKDAVLAAEMRFNADTLFLRKDADILGLVEHITSVVAKLIGKPEFDPYEITQQMLNDLVDDAREFTGKLGMAHERLSEATVGNSKINDVLKDIRNNFSRMDLLITRFSKQHPKFVEGYRINKRLDRTGIRHTGIEGLVKDEDGNPIAHAIIKLKDTDYKTTSDINGVHRLIKVLTAEYIVEVSALGFEPLSAMHHIKRGKIGVVDFMLKKK